MIVVSNCLSSDALSQCLPSYLGFSYLGRVVTPLGCASVLSVVAATIDRQITEWQKNFKFATKDYLF